MLAQLSEWGNLESQPDTARVSSLSDFYRARFLYRLSQGGEAVEAGFVVLLQTLRRRAELQTAALEDIAGRLLALRQLIETNIDGKGPDVVKAHETLRDLVRVFEDLAENAPIRQHRSVDSVSDAAPGDARDQEDQRIERWRAWKERWKGHDRTATDVDQRQLYVSTLTERSMRTAVER